MWAYLVIGVVGMVLVAYYAWRQDTEIAAFTRVPEVRLAQAEAGVRVRVTGAVGEVGELTTAPFSGTPCIAALGERWELTSRGTPFRCVDRQVRAATFTIDDGTAVARVIADHVRCVLKTLPATIATSGPGRAFGAGVLAANMERMGNHQVREGFVSAGERAIVIATVRRTEAGELELIGSAAEPVVIYK